MTPKFEIEEVPVSDRFLKRRRIVQERGELALIEDGRSFQHLAYFSLKSGQGHFRGGHYHLKKVEHLYVISGKLLIKLLDLDTGEYLELEVPAGRTLVLHPNCVHRFEAREDAQVIEYYDSVYDRDDDRVYQAFMP